MITILDSIVAITGPLTVC